MEEGNDELGNRTEVNHLEIGIIEDFDQENLDLNLKSQTRRTTESQIMGKRVKNLDQYFNTNRVMADGKITRDEDI